MNVKLSTPTVMMIHRDFKKIVAEGTQGNFCVLPRHTDYLSSLVPGVLILTDEDDRVFYFAIDHGLLVKRGTEVFISVRRAIQGSNLEQLQEAVRNRFLRLDESEKACQTAVASLEASFLRRFLEMQWEAT